MPAPRSPVNRGLGGLNIRDFATLDPMVEQEAVIARFCCGWNFRKERIGQMEGEQRAILRPKTQV